MPWHGGRSGDLYGTTHAEPRGMIWLFWLGATLPWSPVLAVLAFSYRRAGRARPAPGQRHAYLLLWAVTPMAFFSVAGNILPTCVPPGLPALAMLPGVALAGRSLISSSLSGRGFAPRSAKVPW